MQSWVLLSRVLDSPSLLAKHVSHSRESFFAGEFALESLLNGGSPLRGGELSDPGKRRPGLCGRNGVHGDSELRVIAEFRLADHGGEDGQLAFRGGGHRGD